MDIKYIQLHRKGQIGTNASKMWQRHLDIIAVPENYIFFQSIASILESVITFFFLNIIRPH